MVPVIVILTSIIACSIFGNASEKTVDYDNILTDIRHTYSEENNKNTETWPELCNNYIRYDENVNEFIANADTIRDYKTKINSKATVEGNIREFDDNIVERDLNINDDDILGRYLEFKAEANEAKFDENVIYADTREKFGKKVVKLIKKSKRINQRHNQIDDDIDNLNGRVKRDVEDSELNCTIVDEKDGNLYIIPPLNVDRKTYINHVNCTLQMNATSDDMIIELTFVDIFGIEYHSDCAYDYLEIRDGLFGYSRLIGKVCGSTFPPRMRTTGPNVWVKFHSDDAIEDRGFKIKVTFRKGASYSIPQACFMRKRVEYGEIGTTLIDPDCKSGNANQALDVLWTIETSEGTQIYLNFTKFELASPNLCAENIVEVFGPVLEESSRLAFFCGTMSNYVMTKGNQSNKMHVRLLASREARAGLHLAANFSAFRTLDASKNEACLSTEFNCEDNTCISKNLLCDGTAHCRLKTDEDERCDSVTQSVLAEFEVLIICIIFSLILAFMTAIFLFKFGWKVYKDQQIIKQHLKQSCENHLVDFGSRLTLDPKLLVDSESKLGLDQENYTNEQFKKQKNIVKNEVPSSNSSKSNEETLLDLNDHVTRHIERFLTIQEDVNIERPDRKRQSDMSDDSLRRKKRDRDIERLNRNEMRDVEGPNRKEMRDIEEYNKNEMRDVERLNRREMRDIEGLNRKEMTDEEGLSRKEMRDIKGYDTKERRDIEGYSKKDMRVIEGLNRKDMRDIKGDDKKEMRDIEGYSKKDIRVLDGLNRKDMRDIEGYDEKEMRDVSVVATDMKESSCQTRDSLFLTDPSSSSGGSRKGSHSRVVSSPGSSAAGATATSPRSTVIPPRPTATPPHPTATPPRPTATPPRPSAASPRSSSSHITIELVRQDSNTYETIPESRPTSTETTRSAPDVIISV